MLLRTLSALLLLASLALAQTPKSLPRDYLPPLYDTYFQKAVGGLSHDWSAGITAENWPERRAEMRHELEHMLGLDPMPERTELNPVISGTLQGDGYRVEKLYFQSRPGLYVTGDLYLPADTSKPCPTILYVCGHAVVKENNIPMGNKTGYQHHGSWFARHGYVCLIIDTIELGEISGEHHGTFSKGRWWWVSRGYTPAGVEAWNGMRALDYLETRPEVDRTRFGVTGRSGGGAYSWYIAALDERIKAAVPTAGITTMSNHILTGCIEGHCDCMFMVNSDRWDFDRLAALVAPRALCIANTDKDGIFPIDGVMETYQRTRAFYRQLDAEKNIGLQIAEGPHLDTQPLNTGAFHWMNRFLKGATAMDLTDEPARKLHKPAELKVFTKIPEDEKVTTADEWFVPKYEAKAAPASASAWDAQRRSWMTALTHDTFGAWPATAPKAHLEPLTDVQNGGLRLRSYRLIGAQEHFAKVWLLSRAQLQPAETEITVLNVLDDAGWSDFQKMRDNFFPPAGENPNAEDFAAERRMFENQNWVMAYLTPRGTGESTLATLPEKKRTQMLRRFQLMGETLESGQVWEIAEALSALPEAGAIWVQAEGEMAVNSVYASLFSPRVARLDLHRVPLSHVTGPTYVNVLRYLDVPQAVAMAAERCTVALYTEHPEEWAYPRAVVDKLNWPAKRLQLRSEKGAGEGK